MSREPWNSHFRWFKKSISRPILALKDFCTHVQVILFKACILTFVGRELAQMLQHD